MMGIYKNTSTSSSDLYVEEQMMYGSSRLGSVILKEKLVTPSGTPTYVQKRGQKRYELNNHLGNVLTTVSDRRRMVCSTTSIEADVISTADYSPFGAPLPGRSLGATKCTNYSYNTTLYAINEAFGTTVNPLPIVTSPTPSTAGYFVYTTNTGGSITSGVMTFQNTNVTAATRGVGKNFAVLSGKNYTLSFKAKKGTSSGTTTYYYRVIDAATSTVIVPQTTLSLTTAFVTYTASFTPSANATYRIQFYSTTAAGASFQYIVDDLVISYPDVITNTVCVPTGGDYRFGFNGKEKLNEAYGEGNCYDYGARMMDVRIGRWLACDPQASKYPFFSSYVGMGNNPLIYTDPEGETLKVEMNENKKMAIRDLKSIMPIGTRSALRVSNDGTVRLKMTKKVKSMLDKDMGLIIINGIIDSEKTVLYEVAQKTETYTIADRESKSDPIIRGEKKNVDLYITDDKDNNNGHGIINATENYPKVCLINFERTRQGETVYVEFEDMPKAGYNGQVTIAPGGSWSAGEQKSRESIVFHELGENYLQTIKGFCYIDAHTSMQTFERNLPDNDTRKSKYPGWADYQSPKEVGTSK